MHNVAEDSPVELPEQLQEIQEIAGTAAMHAIVDAWGGLDLRVPRQFDPSHELVMVVGEAAAVAIIRRFSGEKPYIPKLSALTRAARDKEVFDRHYGSGITVDQLAREYRLSARRIWQILSRNQEASPQANLFPDD